MVKFRYNLNSKDHETEILEALQPHPNLRSLVIDNCLGTTLSTKWMMSLINITSLKLEDCYNCEILAPLGKIPMLKSLCVIDMKMLTKVGPEFLAIITFKAKRVWSSTQIIFYFLPRVGKSHIYNDRAVGELWRPHDISVTLDAGVLITPCLFLGIVL